MHASVDDATTATDRCASCGLPVEEGLPQCRRIFDEILAQHFSNRAYATIHRLFVDAYCLQHPERGCISFKSFSTHATHMCWSLERGGSHALPNEHIRSWVERHADLEKPPLPGSRGTVTIADVVRAEAPHEREQAVERWARDVWRAYEELHSTIRYWLDLAKGDDIEETPSTRAGRRGRSHGG